MSIKIGVIGCGYWGPNLVRNFSSIKTCELLAASDINPERTGAIKVLYPNVETYENPQDLMNRTDIEAVAIATPVSTHYPLAAEALEKDKHVLLEK